MQLDEISREHHEWIREMGWIGTTTVLEQIALIASEVGEAANECRGAVPTDKLPDELADIILRTLGLFERIGVSPTEAVLAKMAKNRAKGNRGRAK